jgi:hypothetical protein
MSPARLGTYIRCIVIVGLAVGAPGVLYAQNEESIRHAQQSNGSDLASELAKWDKQKGQSGGAPGSTTPPAPPADPRLETADPKRRKDARSESHPPPIVKAATQREGSELETELALWDKEQDARRAAAVKSERQRQINFELDRQRQAQQQAETARENAARQALAAREEATQEEQNRQAQVMAECETACRHQKSSCEAENGARAAGSLGANLGALLSHSHTSAPPPEMTDCESPHGLCSANCQR